MLAALSLHLTRLLLNLLDLDLLVFPQAVLFLEISHEHLHLLLPDPKFLSERLQLHTLVLRVRGLCNLDALKLILLFQVLDFLLQLHLQVLLLL